jgi:hypothetical protein
VDVAGLGAGAGPKLVDELGSAILLALTGGHTGNEDKRHFNSLS